MFCMYFMIKKIILEGFNDRGGANVRGRRGKNFKKTTNNKNKSTNHQTKDVFWLFLDVYWTRTHHFLHVCFFYIPERSGMVPGPGEP